MTTTTLTLACIDQSRIVALPPRTLLAIDDRRGGTLRIERGEAWVTCGDGTPDRVLRAGDRVAIGTSDKTLVSPVPHTQGEVVVGIEPAHRTANPLRRRLAVLREALRMAVMPQPQA